MKITPTQIHNLTKPKCYCSIIAPTIILPAPSCPKKLQHIAMNTLGSTTVCMYVLCCTNYQIFQRLHSALHVWFYHAHFPSNPELSLSILYHVRVLSVCTKKKKKQRQNLLTDMSGFEDYIPTKNKNKTRVFSLELDGTLQRNCWLGCPTV